MSTVRTRDWADVLYEHAPREETARRLVGQLRACEVAALAFCRLLERWARGDADPCTPGRRQAALRRAADRTETALAGLDRPLSRYLLELEPEIAEGRSWYGGPGAGELREWDEVLDRAGVRVSATRVAQVYLELAVLVRALEGLGGRVPHGLDAGQRLALGRPVRPPREPPRPGRGRSARPRRVAALPDPATPNRHRIVTDRCAFARYARSGWRVDRLPHPGWGALREDQESCRPPLESRP